LALARAGFVSSAEWPYGADTSVAELLPMRDRPVACASHDGERDVHTTPDTQSLESDRCGRRRRRLLPDPCRARAGCRYGSPVEAGIRSAAAPADRPSGGQGRAARSAATRTAAHPDQHTHHRAPRRRMETPDDPPLHPIPVLHRMRSRILAIGRPVDRPPADLREPDLGSQFPSTATAPIPPDSSSSRHSPTALGAETMRTSAECVAWA
jgi:hypothetical protein